jgi:hypothetical protein
MSVRTLGRQWEFLAAGTEPPLPPALLVAGRETQVQELQTALSGPPSVIAVRAGSRVEAIGFMAAALGVADVEPDHAPEQPLWVRDAPTFERLALSERPLTLVAAVDSIDPGVAVARGHRVLLALGGGDYERPGVISLPRVSRTAAREALDAAGLPFERADRLAALARRSFAALLRELSLARGGVRPAWAVGSDALLLSALMLLGGWGTAEGDEEVIAELTGQTRVDVERHLAALGAADDPPWTRSGGAWQSVSPDDSFALLGDLLDRELLERWAVQAAQVLIEPDPRVDMDMAQRLLADVRGQARRRYSGALRSGMAEAAALLGGRGNEPLPSGVVAADYAARVARDVLSAANAEGSGAAWASLHDALPLLAEAAPDVFLDGVEDGLAVDPSPVLSLFRDGPDSSSLTTHSPHTWLLWALEGVAWSPEHLTRATLVLGELAEREPGGKLTNRPSASQRAVLLPWHPNTGADLGARLEALDALRGELAGRRLGASDGAHAALSRRRQLHSRPAVSRLGARARSSGA